MSSKSIHKSSKQVQQAYKSRKIILSQLETQGYNVEKYNNFTINDVYAMYNSEQMDMLIDKPSGAKIYVKYYIAKLIRPKSIYEIVDELFEYSGELNKETDSILFIIKTEPNDTITKEIEHLWNSSGIYINIQNIASLQYNVLTHSYVPKHEVLNEVETARFMEEYNVTDLKKQLSTISRFDPVAIAIGLRPNQVARITRKSPTSIETYYYRICV